MFEAFQVCPGNNGLTLTDFASSFATFRCPKHELSFPSPQCHPLTPTSRCPLQAGVTPRSLLLETIDAFGYFGGTQRTTPNSSTTVKGLVPLY